jgi:hypothetical protein
VTGAAARSGTGRRHRRFPVMLRTRPSNLALASLGLAAAAIIGVQMGQSAISEINPIHFQGPLERPRAITPPPEPAPFDPYAQPYVWSMPPSRSLADCGPECDTSRQAVDLALGEPAGRDAALPYWRDATPATELRPWAPGRLPDSGVRVERYMHYPVDSEQVERPLAEAPDPAPAAADPAAPLRPARTAPKPAAALSVAPVAED